MRRLELSGGEALVALEGVRQLGVGRPCSARRRLRGASLRTRSPPCRPPPALEWPPLFFSTPALGCRSTRPAACGPSATPHVSRIVARATPDKTGAKTCASSPNAQRRLPARRTERGEGRGKPCSTRPAQLLARSASGPGARRAGGGPAPVARGPPSGRAGAPAQRGVERPRSRSITWCPQASSSQAFLSFVTVRWSRVPAFVSEVPSTARSRGWRARRELERHQVAFPRAELRAPSAPPRGGAPLGAAPRVRPVASCSARAARGACAAAARRAPRCARSRTARPRGPARRPVAGRLR